MREMSLISLHCQDKNLILHSFIKDYEKCFVHYQDETFLYQFTPKKPFNVILTEQETLLSPLSSLCVN